ncbi:MAG: hypothetical protein WKG00_29410 [Polyangiaceae bacterium]
MPHWTGFADLGFTGSARLAMARAHERAETEAQEALREAWEIDDRHVAFCFEGETSRAVLEGCRRLLEALVLLATSGEALLECKGSRDAVGERWVLRAGAPSVSKELVVGDEGEPPSTLRTRAG